MLVVDGGCSTPGSASPSLLDSPTLQRVERARLRHEGGNTPLLQAARCQSLLSANGRDIHTIKKGLLWQQRDRIFSRWKERYFILTRDYLHCFKRASGTDKISDMGQFIFKVKLVDVEHIEWINKKTYSTIALDLGRDGRVLLRTPDGLEDWFELLEECMMASKERRKALRYSHDSNVHHRDGEAQNNNSINSSLEEWLLARHKITSLQHMSDSVPDLNQEKGARDSRASTRRGFDEDREDEHWIRRRPPNHEQRLSLLTDIDINGCDMLTDTPPPSVPSSYRGRPTSYRLNSDIFFMSTAPSETSERLRYTSGTATPSFCSSRSVLTPVGSFRSTHLFNPSKMAADRLSIFGDSSDTSRFRDRSHSEAHRIDRHSWKTKTDSLHRASFVVHATQV